MVDRRDQVLGGDDAPAAVLLGPVQARVTRGVEQARCNSCPREPLGSRVAGGLRRQRRSARRATRAARHETIRRHQNSAAPRSGESTRGSTRSIASEKAVRVRHASRARREGGAGPSALRAAGAVTQEEETSSCHHRPGVHHLGRRQVEHDRRSPKQRSTVRRCDEFWRHDSQSAKQSLPEGSAAVGNASASTPPTRGRASAHLAVSRGPVLAAGGSLHLRSGRIPSLSTAGRRLEDISRICREPATYPPGAVPDAREDAQDHQRGRPRRGDRHLFERWVPAQATALRGPQSRGGRIGVMKHIGGGSPSRRRRTTGRRPIVGLRGPLYHQKGHVAAGARP